MRSTHATRAILEAFTDPTAKLYGYDIMRRTGLKSGAVYPILRRLEAAGWVSSKWENIDPGAAGRPVRRVYRLTAVGLAELPRFVDA